MNRDREEDEMTEEEKEEEVRWNILDRDIARIFWPCYSPNVLAITYTHHLLKQLGFSPRYTNYLEPNFGRKIVPAKPYNEDNCPRYRVSRRVQIFPPKFWRGIIPPTL